MIRKAVTPRSREIVEIFADIVGKVHEGLDISYTDYLGETFTESCDPVRYVFGNTRDVKASLDEMSKSIVGEQSKLPMIALFTPVNETRNNPKYHSQAKVNLLIACQTNRDWNNEQRRDTSFSQILRPLYRRLLEEIAADGRIEVGYDGRISHQYSENYSYGRYGAMTSTGEEVSQPIDAIDIRNLELNIINLSCDYEIQNL